MGFTSEEAKELVATTRATLAQEAEQAATQATTNQQTEHAINQESTKRKAARTSSNDANEATAKNSKPRKGAAANKS